MVKNPGRAGARARCRASAAVTRQAGGDDVGGVEPCTTMSKRPDVVTGAGAATAPGAAAPVADEDASDEGLPRAVVAPRSGARGAAHGAAGAIAGRDPAVQAGASEAAHRRIRARCSSGVRGPVAARTPVTVAVG